MNEKLSIDKLVDTKRMDKCNIFNDRTYKNLNIEQKSSERECSFH